MSKKLLQFSAVGLAALIWLSFQGLPPSGSTEASPPSPGAQFDPSQQPLVLKLTLGLNDPEPRDWNGVAHLNRGNFLKIQGWNFDEEASEEVQELKIAWRVRSKRAQLDTSWTSKGRGRAPYGFSQTRPVGVWLQIEAPRNARLDVNTVQGNFQVPLQEIPSEGPLFVLDGKASVERSVIALPLSQTASQEDYPTLAAGPEGRLYSAWIAYEDGRDTLFYSPLGSKGWEEPIQIGGSGTRDIYGSAALLPKGEELWLLYTLLAEDQFDLWARRLLPSEGDAVRLSNDPGNDINPVTAVNSRGQAWVAWQGLRNQNSDIYARDLSRLPQIGPEIRVSSHAGTDWHPTVAVDSSGSVAVAWDSYRNGDYDIYSRRIDGRGQLGPPQPVSATRLYEANASAVFDQQDQLWIAWEESGPNWGKDTAKESSNEGTRLHTDRKIRLRCWKEGSWHRLRQDLQSTFLNLPLNFQEQPRLVVDKSGNLWIVFRQWLSRGYPDEVWNLYAVRYNGAAWSEPLQIPFSDGRLTQESPAIALPDGSVWVAYATDYRGAGNRLMGEWDLKSARLSAGPEAARAADLQTADPPHPETEYRPTPNKNYETRVGGKTYRLYYGDLHRHTDIVGHGKTDPSISGQYRYALDAAELDFMATTDHNQTYNMTAKGELREGKLDALDEYGWWRTQKVADMYLFPGRFVSLYGYERSMEDPGGHRNLIWPERRGELIPGDMGIPSENIPLGLWERLKLTDGISIPHSPLGPRVSWKWHDPISQPVVEMYQGYRRSYEYANAAPDESRGHLDNRTEGPYFLWDALGRGHRIGVIASSDHESTHMSYAGVWASEFTRNGIFEGLKQRRTLASTDNMVIDFRIGDTFMGGETNVSAPPKLEIKALGTGPIRQIDIVKDNTFAFSTSPHQAQAEVTYVDQNSHHGTSYYYVRVIQEDGMMAWSSAIWVTRR